MPNRIVTWLYHAGKALVRSANLPLTALDQWMDWAAGFGAPLSAAGVPVNETTALSYNPVLAAANVISQDFAALPIEVFELRGEAKVAVDSSVAYKLKYEPNPLMSSFTWRQVMMSHAIWRGNAFSLFTWDASGRLSGIWPQHPSRVKVRYEDGVLDYLIRRKDGTYEVFESGDVLHIKGLGGDGIVGYSIIQLLADSLGIPIAAERFNARYFANDATPGLVLKHPGKLSRTAHDNIRQSFEARHKGVDNSHVLGIIEEGMDAISLPVRADQVQLLDTRKFGVEDVSRITRVPLHMLGSLDRSTNNNIEHQGLEYGKHCQGPWAINWQQELNRKLFHGTPYFPEFDLSELYRGDALSRAQANQIKFQNGALSIDEWRREDGRNPVMGGDLRIIPLNMQPAPGTKAQLLMPAVAATKPNGVAKEAQ